MNYTPLSHLTDEELLRHGRFALDTPTPLELELLHRLEMRLNEEEDNPPHGNLR